MKWLEFFLPRENHFYSMLNDMARYASESCKLLDAFIGAKDENEQKELAEKIIVLRKDAKQLNNDTQLRLMNSFITPFDREDIQEFSSILYRIPKQVDKIRSRLMMQVISLDDKNVLKLMDIVVEESEALQFLVDNLNKRQIVKMRKKAKRIEQLEQKADEVLLDVASSFSNTKKNFFKALLKKDVYDMLEKLTDLYKDGSDVAMRIILKHT